MKMIVTESASFGPFKTIETLDDRYHADGQDLQFSVIGPATIGDWVEPTPAPVVPAKVTARQGWAVLLLHGITQEEVESLIPSLIQDETDRALALNDLRKSTAFERDWPLVNAAAPALGLSQQDLDALFIQAATL